MSNKVISIEKVLSQAKSALKKKRTAEATALYQQILDADPNHPVARKNLRKLQKQTNQDPVRLDPPDSQLNNLIQLYHSQRSVQAEQVCREMLQTYPNSAITLNIFAAVLAGQNRNSEALQTINKAINLNPRFTDAFINRANILLALGRLESAVKSYHKAIDCDPDNPTIYNNLGVAHKDLGQFQDAIDSYTRAIELRSDFVTAYNNLLYTLNLTSDYSLEHKIKSARQFGELVSSNVEQQFRHNYSSTPKKLRIGFVSGDLWNHPVGYFLEELLSKLDYSQFELVAYPTTRKSDSLTERIRPHFSHWKPIVNESDKAAAKLIHSDGIHILFDLSGHTPNNRLSVFAWKPAPIQVSWLGYFATTGVREIDYLIGDPYVTPGHENSHYLEDIFNLPNTYLCFTPPVTQIEVSPPPVNDKGFVTFGCFNSLIKVNDKVVETWARILSGSPESKLFLKSKSLQSEEAQKNAVDRFRNFGIHKGRLVLEGPSPREELLKAYSQVDIALDPFPYPGGTTTAEALWMGVPTITMKGNTFLSHIGESIAHNSGLAAWIADSSEDYVLKALSFSKNTDHLTKLRSGLRGQLASSPLFDADRFAQQFQDGLWAMWQQKLS